MMGKSLHELMPVEIAGLSQRSVMVLSDAFPPYVAGGAEVSLLGTLDRLSQETREKIVVCTFADEIEQVGYHEYRGMAVLHCPNVAPWPYNRKLNPAYMRDRKKFLLGPVWHDRLLRKQVEKFGPNRRRARKMLIHSRTPPKGGIITDEFIDAHDARVKFISEVAGYMQRIDVLLADNTRSILIGAEMIRTRPVTSAVAVVRDNRFHCPRPSQNRLVKGKICTDCTFKCAREDAAGQVEAQQENLRRTSEKRQSSLNAFNKVIVTSHELERHVGPLLKPDQELARIPNTYGDLAEIEAVLPQVAQPQKMKNLVIVGMLNENKGQLAFLQEARKWLEAHRDVRIVLCGRGVRIQKEIEAFKKKFKLERQVRLVGFRDRVGIFEELRKAYLVLAPTVWPEPFGRVPLEAAVSRRAIVAFGVGGLTESITHGVNGYLAPPNDYARFLELVDHLLEDGRTRTTMERRAYEIAISRYGPDKTSDVFCRFAFGEGALANEDSSRMDDDALGTQSEPGGAYARSRTAAE